MSSATRNQMFLKYMKSLDQYKVLSKEEEHKLAREYAKTKDPKVANKLITANLKFVAKVAYKYSNAGFEMMDLIQEGNEAMMTALRKFNPDRGYKFISYAVWWIRAHINRYIINNHSQVKLGTTQAQRMLFFKLRSEKAKMISEKGTENVSSEELAEVLGCEASDIDEMEVRLAARDFSLQSELGGHSETTGHVTFQDNLVDENPNQLAKLEDGFAAQRIRDLIDRLDLSEKEQYIIEHRLMNPEPATLQDIGVVFKVSRERVRQIEARLKNRLKKAFLEDEDDYHATDDSSELVPYSEGMGG